MVFGECADRPGKAIGALEKAQRRPLGGIQAGTECVRTGAMAQLLYQLGHRSLGGGGYLQHGKIVASRNYIFNNRQANSPVSGPMCGSRRFSDSPKAITFQAAAMGLTAVFTIRGTRGKPEAVVCCRS